MRQSISFISIFSREITSWATGTPGYSARIMSRIRSRYILKSSAPWYFTDEMVAVPSFTARLKSLSTITPSPISVYLYASSPTYHPPSVFFRQMTVGITQVSSRPATAAWV